MKLGKTKLIGIVAFVALVVGASFGILLGASFNKEEASFDNDTSKTKQVVRENTLSMMIEQTAGAGDYKMETRSSWPTEGYKFNASLSKCENGGELGWNSEKGVVTMTGNMSDKCYIYFDRVITLANYIKSKYTSQGTNGLYYHNSSLTNGAGDNSYRYAGASDSLNNYVCVSNESTCSDASLFRIIGVFDEGVKLIRATSIGNIYWDSNNSNTWSTASLNTYLNGTYLTSLEDFADKVAETTWKVGGNTSANIYSVVPATAYANEITSPQVGSYSKDNATTYGPNEKSKIGLMYVSDYGFAADPTAWTTILNKYDGSVNGSTITSLNWMYVGLQEYTISRISDSGYNVCAISSSGYIYGEFAGDADMGRVSRAVRPTFYLTSDVTYKSGFGTSSEPYRINLD